MTTTTAATDTHRLRLIDGMIAAVTERGYAATTIADVVRHARVSKRTFYEHFADKLDCLLATYTHASDLLLGVIADAAAAELPWEQRLRHTVLAYLSALADRPAVTRTMFTEILSAGPRALPVRREVLQRFAELLRSLVNQGAAQHREVRELGPSTAMAITGGINELVLQAVEDDRVEALTELADTAVDVVRAVLTDPGRARHASR